MPDQIRFAAGVVDNTATAAYSPPTCLQRTMEPYSDQASQRAYKKLGAIPYDVIRRAGLVSPVRRGQSESRVRRAARRR